VVGLAPQSDTLLFGECKWTDRAVGTKLLDDRKAVAPEVRWHGSARTVEYALFARSGFTETMRSLSDDRDDLQYTSAEVETLLEPR
jgi:hypothetical protein